MNLSQLIFDFFTNIKFIVIDIKFNGGYQHV
uniref:Uncharacterized protein n=1 Tax=Siphoviridae sp. ctgN495 TaxID=2825608 RepID=A0A8S5UCW7_9CAUD|nr:MAG TPA: hypothetical protein [Siphoviridae sp. ctgN495]